MENKSSNQPVYRNVTKAEPSDLKTILWIAFVFPVGLWKMWKHEKFAPRTRWIVTGVFSLVLLSHFSQTGSYSDHVKSRPQATVASELAKTKKSYQLDRLGREIQDRIQKGKSPLDYAVTVNHLEFQGHDLLVCNVNTGKGNCGVYEVIEKDGDFRAYWVNGKAKSASGAVMDRTPSSIDPSAAYRAATK